MKIGWNLGNTMDCFGSWLTGKSPYEFETAWGNPVTTKDLILKVKDAGFNAIRVPVTYQNHMEADGTINKDWMDRVEKIVNYILDADMYCIINVHHDTGSDESAWLRADMVKYSIIRERFQSLWRQIAARFSSYDEKLLFEGYNEVLDKNSSWGNTDDDGYKALNNLAQLFVYTVRGTGGNNLKRNLIVSTYSADPGEKTVSSFKMPDDITDNHLIVEVHVYTPLDFTFDESWLTDNTSVWKPIFETELNLIFKRLYDSFISKGVPVIIGEFAAINKNNTKDRAAYASYFIKHAKQYKIACFWWDGGIGMGLIDRNRNEWIYPEIIDSLMKAIYVE